VVGGVRPGTSSRGNASSSCALSVSRFSSSPSSSLARPPSACQALPSSSFSAFLAACRDDGPEASYMVPRIEHFLSTSLFSVSVPVLSLKT
jgi:hypothetical protein